ncbi:MAG: 4Fe-4S dicluster domain-containing protein [Synechococcus sp. SB0666_bin_14]|nr:4Fe-4S dicluster domain-containing protein [Synechococcus sp. SB0666_bin_14]MYA91256.1 4Fe-4S dicluster domain-containing protein [Synechococcus sp. SB0663_bin_10]MYG47496.1 4Fe-4S dicluster domain-containing protein [Synechococcus sp. SB0675_bin_6]MYJ59382.1 4Fe-4S dicluster domain-containing protein [Synechococcus sp. SB0672_bin_6]MYK91009.1 4Fe-4S dicluster domain-containing protein [Synechococcus sp. SB0669_bin_8]
MDPSLALTTPADGSSRPTGLEPLLGGALREKAVWVDESVCIGCRYCANVCPNTFLIEPDFGRSRAVRQDGDSTQRIQEAVDTCPVDCIHWVSYEDLGKLRKTLGEQQFQALGFATPSKRKRPQ